MLRVTNLSGFGGGNRVLHTLSEHASATSTASTVTGPSTIIAGDILVLWDRASNAVAPAPSSVTPTGFSNVLDFTIGPTKGMASVKVADGSEASASITGMDGSASDRKMLYVFRGNIPATTATAQDAASEGTDGNPAAQTANASGSTKPVIVIGCYGSGSAVDPRTFSPAKDGEISAATNAWLAYKIYNSSPQDVTIDMDDEGLQNTLGSFYLECA